jgi:large subunit ribosomal protein L10
LIFTDYRGLTVAELSELRNLLREGNFDYKVVKNTLAKIACEGTPVAAAKDSFKGPVGIAIGYDDPVLTVKNVAVLPPKKVLLSVMAGGFKSPLNKLARLLNATLSNFVNGLEALKDKKSC